RPHLALALCRGAVDLVVGLVADLEPQPLDALLGAARALAAIAADITRVGLDAAGREVAHAALLGGVTHCDLTCGLAVAVLVTLRRRGGDLFRRFGRVLGLLLAVALHHEVVGRDLLGAGDLIVWSVHGILGLGVGVLRGR